MNAPLFVPFRFRRGAALIAAAVCVAAAGIAPAGAADAPAPRDPAAADGQHDFDFFFGQWDGLQHRLKQRLHHSTEWDDFQSHIVARPLLGGRANTDEVVFRNGTSSGGATFRLYDPEKKQWSIYWIGTTSYALDPPVVGHFVGDTAEFYGDDVWEGKKVKVRFIWKKGDLTHCHWEQAFSEDGGKTWETNWSVEWVRTAF